jgi:hypothetical protein
MRCSPGRARRARRGNHRSPSRRFPDAVHRTLSVVRTYGLHRNTLIKVRCRESGTYRRNIANLWNVPQPIVGTRIGRVGARLSSVADVVLNRLGLHSGCLNLAGCQHPCGRRGIIHSVPPFTGRLRLPAGGGSCPQRNRRATNEPPAGHVPLIGRRSAQPCEGYP